MRRHRVFLLCTVGLCVISFLHYYKALHYVSLLRELSAPYPNIKSFIMVTGFFWREKGMATTPLSPASPEEAPPLPGLRQSDAKARGVPGLGGGGGGQGFGPGIPEAIAGGGDEEMRQREEPAPPHPWEKPKENQLGDAANEVRWVNPNATARCRTPHNLHLQTNLCLCISSFQLKLPHRSLDLSPVSHPFPGLLFCFLSKATKRVLLKMQILPHSAPGFVFLDPGDSVSFKMLVCITTVVLKRQSHMAGQASNQPRQQYLTFLQD